MKYLFLFNGQLFLLCCMCCKIAIQDFVTPLQKKIRKIYGFTDGSTDRIKPVGISQRVEKKLRDCATFTDGVTDGLKHVGISQRVAKHLRDCATITDGITDELTHIPKRTHVRHVSVCTNTDGSKSLAGFSNFFGAHFN